MQRGYGREEKDVKLQNIPETFNECRRHPGFKSDGCPVCSQDLEGSLFNHEGQY